MFSMLCLSLSGRQVAGLVREFLQHFNLDYTLAVFDPESGCVCIVSLQKVYVRTIIYC